MWVFTTDGFYSAVHYRGEGEYTLVRTRTREDADALVGRLEPPGYYKVVTTPDADYGWRVVVPTNVWGHYLDEAARRVEYTNFKNAVARTAGRKRASVYHDVWADLLELQRTET